MKITFKKERGQLIPFSDADYDAISKMADGAVYEVDIKNFDMRTLKQNRALHKFFTMVSETMNNRGLTPKKVIKIDLEWTPTAVKEMLWRPVQESVLNKKSTTKLKKEEITKVYDILNMAFGERLGFNVAFPHRDLE